MWHEKPPPASDRRGHSENASGACHEFKGKIPMPAELPANMRFVGLTGPGGPEVLELRSMPTPVPGAHEVVIKVHAAGINRPDILQRQGKYPPPPGASPVLGLEVAGIVATAGKEAKPKVGDAVCALVPGGGYAEYCQVPGAHCLPVPRGLSLLQAGGIPETFFTVWANVFQIAGLKRGELFLVHGGAGGIGTTAMQLAHASGAQVFTTAGTDEKCARCLTLGADHAFNYKSQDFAEEIKRITAGRGVDVILDMVGGDYAERNVDSLAMRGRLVQIAVQKGANVTLNLAKIMQKRLIVTGSTLRPRSIEEKAAIARELQVHAWPLLEDGKVKVIIDRVFPFTQVKQAHDYFERGAHVGKVILDMTA
jgi:putative PIG3 family NAD(P)H quinone oxidoreductase